MRAYHTPTLHCGSRSTSNAGLPEPLACHFVVCLVDVLATLHGAGLLHRDLKAENVLLRAGDGCPLLCDFGFCRPDASAAVWVDRHGPEAHVAATDATEGPASLSRPKHHTAAAMPRPLPHVPCPQDPCCSDARRLLGAVAAHRTATGIHTPTHCDEAVAAGVSPRTHAGADTDATFCLPCTARRVVAAAPFRVFEDAAGVLCDVAEASLLLDEPPLDSAPVTPYPAPPAAAAAASRRSSVLGSEELMAPEVADGEGGAPADVWALGCLAALLLCGRTPLPAPAGAGTAPLLLLPADVAAAHPSAAAFVSACLHPDPLSRPTAAALRAHTWLREGAPETWAALARGEAPSPPPSLLPTPLPLPGAVVRALHRRAGLACGTPIVEYAGPGAPCMDAVVLRLPSLTEEPEGDAAAGDGEECGSLRWGGGGESADDEGGDALLDPAFAEFRPPPWPVAPADWPADIRSPPSS